MKIPEGHTEATVLEAIEQVVGVLAPAFHIGGWTLEDMKQEGRLFCLKLLAQGKYDPSRRLASYMFVNCRRKMINLIRDNVTRNDPPCPRCAGGTPCGPDGSLCREYKDWVERNTTKANLTRPVGLDVVEDHYWANGEAEQKTEIDEILRIIDTKLPSELRSDYLKMRAGVPVSKGRRELIEDIVLDIVHEAEGT